MTLPFTIRSRLALTVLAAVLAVLVAPRLGGRHKEPLVFSNASSVPSAPQPSTLTDEQRQVFHETGVLLLPGLLQGDMLQDAVDAAEHIYQNRDAMTRLFQSRYAQLSFQEWRSTSGLARVAFESNASSIAADLLGETRAIRLIKDALFGQTQEGKGSGFHIDDKAFWPAEDDASGIDIWIALSDYDTTQGGGVRVAPGSHSAEWAFPCRETAFHAAEKYEFANLSQACLADLDSVSVVYDMKPGDALLWDRFVFHRQEPFKVAMDNVHKLRYTVRYASSKVRAAVNGLLHPSIELGKPFDTPYHPQVWPVALEHEMEAIHGGLGTDMNIGRVAKLIASAMFKKYFQSDQAGAKE